MEKATPTEMKKCLEAVEIFKKAGIIFVPMPVFSEADKLFMVKTAAKRMKEIFIKSNSVKKIDISPK